MATQTLQSFMPPNLGVVGPVCRQGNEDRFIMVHDFVHAPTHYSIFDTYYPQVLDNYYVDDWISQVYGPERTKQPKDWEVHHHLRAVGTRYKATYHQDKILPSLVEDGSELVTKTLRNLYGLDVNDQKRRDKLRILGTQTIVSVDGPMRELHLSSMRSNGQ